MRQGLNIHFLIAAVVIIAGIVGCSGGNDGVLPDLPADTQAANSNVAGWDTESGHFVLMSGKFFFDNETGQVINIPDRTLAAHYDVTPMLVPPQCWNCIAFVGLTIDNDNGITRDWHVTVRLKNPSPVLGGYNVRAIFFPHEFITVVNYTGFTKVFGGGLMHPFINWLTNNWQDYDYWPPQFKWDKELVFRIPVSWGAQQLTDKAYLNYKIDACFPGAIKESPYIYDAGVAQYGIWYASAIKGFIDIPIWDWQGDISEVAIDLTPVNPSIGIVKGSFAGYDPGITNNSLSHFHVAVNYNSAPPSNHGKFKCRVTVTDKISPYQLYYDIFVSTTWDLDPPVSFFDQGPYRGLIDLIAGDGFIKFYYDRAIDPSGVFYIFYYNDVKHAWDPGGKYFSKTDCTLIQMNWPPAYPACSYVLPWQNGLGKWWSIDAWDGPNNKAHTTSEKWGRPSKPVERWLKLVGNLGDQNINYGSPIMADMDNDGDDDVVIANRMGAVYCFDGIGGGMPAGLKWVFQTGDSAIYSSPVAGDVTGDNIPEIFITTNGLDEGRVFCINGAIGSKVWSYTTEDIIDPACCLVDLNGDSSLDVVTGDNGGQLYALDGITGNLIWAKPFWTGSDTEGIGTTPAASDVTGDNVPDLAFGVYGSKVYMVNGATGAKIWSHFLTTGGGWNVESSPAMFDANGDSILDVVVGSGNRVVCLDGAGAGGGTTTVIWQTDDLKANFRGSPALGDCNLDGVLDIVIMGYDGTNNDLFIINGINGNALWGVNVPGKKFSNVILADVTADGHLDAIFGVNDHDFTLPISDKEKYFIVNVDRVEYGVILVNIPTTQIPNQAEGMPNAPTLGDVNNDGLWDMVFGSNQGRCYVHNLGTEIPADPALRPWTTFHGNGRRDGLPFKEY